ncbi:MAG TPA: N-acetyltransferase [Terriglobales bacterium]|nr:N-acetyltransferase [Terriglobales bacterium]
MPEIRQYRPDDFEQLWALDQACFSREIAYSRDELAYYLRAPRALCFVAEENGGPMGFILGHQQRGGVGHVVTLDVAPQVQRSGLGSILMKKLEAGFATLGCDSLILEVAVNNHPGLSFYKKHGFSVVKTLRRYYPGGLDGLLMGKKLSTPVP